MSVWVVQEHGLTISVMDYLPMNLVSGRQAGDQVDYFTPVVGTNTSQPLQSTPSIHLGFVL